jgi:UDP-2,3-diacylglucosamine pyrophosphatase LpxH
MRTTIYIHVRASTTMIVAVSDVHLGKYERSEALFRKFLDEVVSDPCVEHLVLIGDILDMWRGNADTLVNSYKDILERLGDLNTEKRAVHYVVGNHDYHMIRRDDLDLYNFLVYPHVVLPSGDETYYFVHGYQFEYPDDMEIYEELANLLCLGGDVLGATVDFFWDLYKETFFALTMPKQWFYKNFGKSIKPPPERLSRKDMKRINKTIKEWRQENRDDISDTFIVYGHTHDPFVDEKNKIANAGSWVDDPKYPLLEKYTYVTIEDGIIEKRLFTV